MTSWPLQVLVTVRERDTGADGILDESLLLVYFREARRAYVGLLNAADDDFRYRMWDARLKVHRVITLDDELAVRVRVDEMGVSSFRMRYLVRDRVTAEDVAEGSTVQLLVDEQGEPIEIPRIFRERVEALEGRAFPRPA